MSAPGEGRLPVAVITGFLGSGKTTMLNWLIRQPEMGRTAVIVNEFGEIGIDNELIAESDENTILLGSGCLCCTVRGDLVETLKDLSLRRMRGDVPPFARIVIETTGLADPAPILHALMSLPVAARYRLDTVVTTVDAVHAAGQLRAQPEAVKQVAVADRIVLTKTDLVAETEIAMLEERLRGISPGVEVERADHGRVPVGVVLDANMYDTATKPADVARWLGEEADGDAIDHGHEHGHPHDVNRHGSDIRAHGFTFDEPMEWPVLAGWLDLLAAGYGERLLRVKGIADVAGTERAVVIHAVQHLFHPPVQVDGFPRGKRRTRLVFITKGLERAELERFLAEARQIAAERASGVPRQGAG